MEYDTIKTFRQFDSFRAAVAVVAATAPRCHLDMGLARLGVF